MQVSKLLQKPPRYVVASILCSFGGFLFGIDTGIIGPVTVMEDFVKSVGNPSPTIHGLIVSSILIPAAISSFFAGKLADTLGRPTGIAIGALIFAVGSTLEAAAVHIGMFVAGRVIEGIGEGLYMGTLVVYICEISPPRHRGALTSGPQLLITLGLMLGYFTCYGTATIASSMSWRLPFILLAAVSFVFASVSLVWLPASPRWLVLRGRNDEATKAWEHLDVLAADREKILDQLDTPMVEGTYANIGNESSSQQGTGVAIHSRSKKSTMPEVFSAESRPRLFLAVFLMGMQQLSGIDGVLYYAPLLFQQAGLSSNESSFLASGVSAIVIFAVTIPAIIWADRWGRRTNTIFGGLGMTCTMFLMGGLYAGNAVHPDSGAGRWIVIVTIYIFTVLYCTSWAVGMKIYAAEIQPQKTRASATNIAHGSNWLTNFLVALVTPTLLANTSYGAYFLFGACTLLTVVVCWVFMPETRGRKLDEIEQAFQASHMVGLKDSMKTFRRKFVKRLPVGGDA
ncbi:general substrate transporter [Truncatella angustata]|uniref:General substrate transporter n=1 Tax=Truncatella angustata TaxID=152316 RepID=A0A9P8U831_9PEZI|nr:general substrate transporter [Truncatella angustata]KAH6643363.1 general substrate transporter [Truncatella angustata]